MYGYHKTTAVCYKHNTDNRKSFSFGYIGKNQPAEPDIRLMSVSDLNNRLSRLYRELSILSDQSIEIFVDDCFGDNNKLVEVQGMFQKLINLQENQAIRACSITNDKPKVRKMDDELRKREVSVGPDAVECQLVPEKQKTAADGSRCSSITESDDSCQCNTGGKTKPCCSSPCFYMDRIKGYRCYSDQKLIECSPPYSLITVNGDRCLDDYPCATYDFEWDYSSPPLKYSKAKNGKYFRSNHACAKYGSKYTWCYTDEGNHDQCCTSDDCYSTVNDQTCRSNHLCGYHDKDYLWCYTDREDNWDYCCRNCRHCHNHTRVSA
uniref:Si:ch211-165i18.2 n=1 Tax=Sinocyclocheilus grahami TaxID=75366 RepID=A0A672KIB0_SINGR